MATANPSRQQLKQSDDPLVAAAQQKVDEAKQRLEELRAADKAARKQTEQNEAQRNLIRQAAALQEAELAQRNEELAVASDKALQQIDRINAALKSVSDEPEPATPDEPVVAPKSAVVDHDVEAPVAKPPAPEPTPKVTPEPTADTQDKPRKTFKQHLQDLWSRMI